MIFIHFNYCSIKGSYKGNLVAIKKICKRSLELTRSVKKELNLMREVFEEISMNLFDLFELLFNFY